VKRFLKNAVGLSLVSVAGTSVAGAWSWPWESSDANKDDDLKILGFQGAILELKEDSFLPFSIKIKNFVYTSEQGVIYRVDISRENNDSEHPFKVIVSEKNNTGEFEDIAFWLLHGPNLDINVDAYVKEWIGWKELNEKVWEAVEENPSGEAEFANEIFTTERAMNSFALKMNACKDFGYWRTYVCEGGSRSLVL